MKNAVILLVALLVGSASAQTTPPLGIIDKTPHLKAFTNARIVIDPDRTINDGTLVIDHGKILAVGSSVEVPPGAEVFDLQGKTIYPGFIDPYAEYGLERAPDPETRKARHPIYDAVRVGGDAWNDAIHAEVDWSRYFAPDHEAAEPWLKQGFTSVQAVRMDGVLRGRSFVTSLGSGLPNDLLVRPYGWQVAAFHKGKSPQEYPGSLMGAIALLRQTFHDVTWYRQAHAAYRKDPSQRMPEFNCAIEALQHLPQEKIIFATGNTLDLLRAARIADEFSLDAVILGSGHEYARIKEVAASGRTLIIPLDFPAPPAVTTIEDELDVTLATLRHWERAPSNPAVLEQNGVAFAFTASGLDKKDEFLSRLRKAVKHGLSRQTALAAITTVPAEICGVADMVGSIVAGKSADFVICDGDIFDDGTAIYATWTQGVPEEFIPLDEPSFAGSYALTLGGGEYNLTITDNRKKGKRKIEGKLLRDSISVSLKDIAHEQDLISFAAALDTFGASGIARFTGRLVASSLGGTVVLGDGSRHTWAAVADTAEVTSTNNTNENEEHDGEITLVSRLTSPNRAFGLETQPPQQNVLIKNATVWTSDTEGVLPNTDVLVTDGHFAAVGQGLTAPDGYMVIDGTDKHLTAGIIDEHSHICISGDVNEGTDAISSEVRISDVVNPDDISMYRSLAGGVTCARIIHGSANPIGGQAEIIKYRWGGGSEDIKYRQAPPSIKFALGENVKQSGWGDQFTTRYPQTRMGVETIIRDAFQTSREYETAWANYTRFGKKDRERTIPPRRNLRWDALVDVMNSKSFITCHAYVQTEVLMLMRLAEQYGFRVPTFIHILEGYKIADEMAAHGAMASSAPDWWAYKFEVYDAIPHNPCILHNHGVVVSINSDSHDMQRRLNQEAAKSVMYCGMSEVDALNMVTINPAKQMKIDQFTGSITVGKDADFVIWNGPPLSVYAHPEQTWVEGRQYFSIEKDLAEREAIEKERTALIQKLLTTDNKDAPPGEKKKGDGDKGPYVDPGTKGGSL